jgi:hypothetical protein
MGSSFRHDVAGGNGNLVAVSMQSPNFVSGSTGWQVTKDGDAEFNNGVFRGTVTGGVFEGTDFIINSSGAFFYSGTPATGNLIVSIAPSAGNDDFSNPYLAGINAYELLSGRNIAVGLSTIGPSSLPGLSLQDVNSPPYIAPGVFGWGSVAETNAEAVITSGRVTNDDVQAEIALNSATMSSSTDGKIQLLAGNISAGYNETLKVNDVTAIVTVAGEVATNTLTVDGNVWSQQPVPAAYPAVGSPSNAGLGTYCNQIVEALIAAGIMS